MQARSLNPTEILVILGKIRSETISLHLALKLFENAKIDEELGCWFIRDDWSSYTTFNGESLHRLSFELFMGQKPLKEVMHLCDRRGCFNPIHLFDGTHSQNMKDAMKKGRVFHISLEKKPFDYRHLTV